MIQLKNKIIATFCLLVVILTTSFFYTTPVYGYYKQIDKDIHVLTDEEAYRLKMKIEVAKDRYDKQLLGTFKITHYCHCAKCCGRANGPTASGEMPVAGVTIATSSAYDFGTLLEIDNHVYTVQDRGGAIKGNKIDIFCSSHQQALQRGVFNTEVYLVKEKNQIVEYAKKFVGNPYVWGGNSLLYGCDCSHFVWNILVDMGYYDGQYKTSGGFLSIGEQIDGLENAAAGDVIIYPGHVAIYDGEGMIIQAKCRSAGITHDRAADHGTILGIRRFTKDSI